jgi:hypothetical protein
VIDAILSGLAALLGEVRGLLTLWLAGKAASTTVERDQLGKTVDILQEQNEIASRPRSDRAGVLGWLRRRAGPKA